jgi:hypothetical protein
LKGRAAKSPTTRLNKGAARAASIPRWMKAVAVGIHFPRAHRLIPPGANEGAMDWPANAQAELSQV